MQIDATALPGVLILTPRRFGDARGWFTETWNAATLAARGIDLTFVQDNHSFSATRGTVRGLHYQAPPHAQAKLVRCGRGRVRDVAVDVRRGAPTYGQWVAVDLSAENGRQLLIPAGFLHGFATLTPDAELLYKCSHGYAPDSDGAVAWDDPDLAIDWGLDGGSEGGSEGGLDGNGDIAPTLSDKDRAAPRLADWTSPFTYDGPLPWETPA